MVIVAGGLEAGTACVTTLLVPAGTGVGLSPGTVDAAAAGGDWDSGAAGLVDAGALGAAEVVEGCREPGKVVIGQIVV